jgi:polyisoprenoid-binding protein YceI
MKKIISLIIINFFIANQAFAKDWQIIPKQSKIEFVTSKDGSPIEGLFEKFSGTIAFDKADLKNSKVAIDVDLNSLNSSFHGAGDRAKSKEWLDVKGFPTASFKSEKFSQVGKDQFHCDGILQLKGAQLPVQLNFYFREYSVTKAVAAGIAKINRSAFRCERCGRN